MTTQQVETATVLGTITGTGNATVTITARDLGSVSPLAVSVAVTDGDTASIVGGLVRTALAFNQYVAAQFLVSGSGANVVLTRHIAAANDSTLNIAIANGTCTGLTAAPTSTNTTAGDGLDNAYCTLAQVKVDDILKFTTTAHDATLEFVVNGVSRKIDEYCGRHFYQTTTSRYYRAKNSDEVYCLPVDDIYTSSGLTVSTDLDGDGAYENVWASTDYYLAPYNNLNGKPYTMLETTPVSQFTFSTLKRGVKVTAAFGWSAVPAAVKLACLMQVNRIWKRFATPLGQSASSSLGALMLSIPSLDPDIMQMLTDFRHRNT
jgi:hypothetical protein